MNLSPLARKDVNTVVDRLLTAQELAERLRVRKAWVYQQIHARRLHIPITRVGHYLRFSERAVEEYLRRMTTK